MKDAWGSMVGVNDLNLGIFRGGDAPADVYRRVFVGINGTPMPSYEKLLTEDQVWDLVNFMFSLRPKDLDAKYKAPRREPPTGLSKSDLPTIRLSK